MLGKRREMAQSLRRTAKTIGIFLALTVFTIPAFSNTVSADINGKSAHVVEDNDAARTYTYKEVKHKFRSWYYKNIAQSTEDENFRISLLYIAKRHTRWGSWGRSALSYAYLRQRSYNVDQAYVSNYKQGDVGLWREIPLYHYAPLDGSADGSNGVGTMFPLRYLVVKYDVPDTFKSHIYRSRGTYLRNSVYSSKYDLDYFAASKWMWVPAANAAHFDPGSGYEIRGYTYSDSWSAQWDWGCWCTKVRHYYDTTYWYINY